ncbi:response regulator [Plantactinospora solaniradicis]|uniref:Response regulator n=1 Tax=Plantactinospora solaniradicis TaxID=1723736 RepID=A0ABW1K636_9ACTN
MIRVLLADDQQLIRAGLRMLCESTEDIEVVGEASNGRDAVRLAYQLSPDVILMDLRMPGLDGVGATREILRQRPASRVVVLTTFDDDQHLYPAMLAGAFGFLAKDLSPPQLISAIRRAAEGDSPFSPAVLRRLLDAALAARSAPPADTVAEVPVSARLTDRERQVLELVAAGEPNAVIAERLNLGITTVKTHIANIMTKTGSRNRIRLAVAAHRHLDDGG